MVAVFFAVAALWVAPAYASGYLLGPQDQLEIRVYDLRTGTGEVYKWLAFDGDYYVNASGAVSLPLLGDVPAAGKTPAELGLIIGERLQSRVGLANRPDTVVQISKYRPFYVMGSVEKPGEYEFRPNLSVLQAVSLAGGLSRVSGDALLGYARDAQSTRGDLRVLTVDRLALLARQARLEAEINDAPKITVPPDIQAHIAESDVARLVREEQMLFDSHGRSLRSQVDVINASKDLLKQQLDSLAAKDTNVAHQLDLVQKELTQVSGLVSKGLVVLPRQLELEQNTAQFQSSRLDVQVATLQAQHELSKADRDILDLTNNRRNEALQEATEVRGKLAEIAEKISTDEALIFQSEVRAPALLSRQRGATESPSYTVVRQTDGKSEVHEAQEGDSLQPGDILKVDPKPLTHDNRLTESDRQSPAASLNLN